MNGQTENQEKSLVVHDDGPFAHLYDTARMNQNWRLAKSMALSTLTPRHLKEDKRGAFTLDEVAANCFQVINQAISWGFNPFSIAKESYVVSGNLGWSGKLVAAVVNTRAGLKSRLKYKFAGKGDDRAITVIGTFEGDEETSEITLSVAQAKTDNQMWKADPDQKLVYSGVIKWARRYCPELVLGVLIDDDVEKIAASHAPADAKLGSSGPNSPSPQRSSWRRTLRFPSLSIRFWAPCRKTSTSRRPSGRTLRSSRNTRRRTIR
jgi:hypothetical protein